MVQKEKNPDHGSGKREFQLTLNGTLYEWNRPIIMGAEIRSLGNIPKEDEIFQENPKPGEDQLIPDGKRVNLARREIERFYSKAKDVALIVNGRPKPWAVGEITFEQVVVLAFGSYDPNPNKVYTVTYDRGPRENPDGAMVKGDKVLVKNKMIFNVTCTDKS